MRDGARVRVRWAKPGAFGGKIPQSGEVGESFRVPTHTPTPDRVSEHAWRYGRVRADAPAPPPNLPGMEGVRAKPAHRAQPALVCLLDGGGALNLRAYDLTDFEVED